MFVPLYMAFFNFHILYLSSIHLFADIKLMDSHSFNNMRD